MFLHFLRDFAVTSPTGFSLHLLVAAALGAIIGFERQWTRHQAGILTNVIVCIGSYAFTAFSFLTLNGHVDITRVASGIVSGIGFLGAGLILREGSNIRGLNTAATVWATSAVGILCCVKNLEYAIIVGVVIVIVHLVLHPISDYISHVRKYDKNDKKKNKEAFYRISVVCPEDSELEVRKSIMRIIKNEPDVLLHTLESTFSRSDEHNKKIRAHISTKTDDDSLVEMLITKVGKNEEIVSAGWKVEND
ncbi:MAG: MgtC/SapB family protein [Eubacterium sp.]|nr:MgtC/SapB family protein [Eubacterium sp.]